MIECILFDSDGTLVDSELLSMQVLAAQMAPYGADLDPDKLHDRFKGWKYGEAIEILKDELNLDLPEDFEAAFRRLQLESFDTLLKPIPGVTELLPRLSQDMAVVTSGPMPKVRKALSVTGLERFFGDNIYSAWEVGIWKPDPGIYLHAAKDMGYGIEQCIAIEDSPIGLVAAVKSGIKSVYLNRFGEESPYDDVIQIESMLELLTILE